MIIKDIDKTAKEQEIINKINLIGDIHTYPKQLGGASVFLLAVRGEAEDKMVILTDMLKPGAVKSIFVSYRPLTIEIRNSDLEIIKCLLSDPRMLAEDIAKETSLSPMTVSSRLEKMGENHILDFTILRDLPSMQLVGYIEFAVIIDIQISYQQT